MKGGAVITAGWGSAALCGQPGGLEVQTQAVSQLAALLHQSREKEGRGTQQGLACPSSASIFLVAPLIMSDVHTFLPSYLIILIIKIIFISPAHREGKKDGDSESTRGGRAVPPQRFCQSLSCLPKETGSVSTHLHGYFRQSRMAKRQMGTPFWRSSPSPFSAELVGGGLLLLSWMCNVLDLFLLRPKAPSLAPVLDAGLEASSCLSAVYVCSIDFKY